MTKKRNYEITVKRVSAVGFNVEAENIQKARELAERDAKNHDWASEDAEYLVDNADAPELLTRIDFTTLRSQKTTLLETMDFIEKSGINWHESVDAKQIVEDLTGILHLIDSIQDYAVDILGVPEMHVFDFEVEEGREG
jgi:hypothetical protein